MFNEIIVFERVFFYSNYSEAMALYSNTLTDITSISIPVDNSTEDHSNYEMLKALCLEGIGTCLLRQLSSNETNYALIVNDILSPLDQAKNILEGHLELKLKHFIDEFHHAVMNNQGFITLNGIQIGMTLLM
jgi:hypothetical protein